MPQRITQLSDFIAKYSADGKSLDKIFSLDQDLATPGFQNSSFKAEEVIADYRELAPQDRFIIFNIFKKRGDTELMKQLVGYGSSPLTNLYPLLNGLDKFKEDLMFDLKTGKDDWSVRLNLAEGLFKYGAMLATIQEQYVGEQRPATAIAELRLLVFNKLKDLYGEVQPADGSGSKYWDTDGDFSPYVEKAAMENYFDHKDADPLNPKIVADSDGDGVDDDNDADSKDKKIWSHIGPASTIKTNFFDVIRAEDGSHTIVIRIFLKPVNGSGDDLAEQLADPAFLEKTSQAIESYYIGHLETGAEDIKLDVQFVTDEKQAHRVVEVSDNNYFRACSTKWRAEVFKKPEVMTHEVMHLLGLPDYYHEGLVDGKLRDHTLEPGFVKIDPLNLMNNEADDSIIRGWQVRRIVAGAWSYRIRGEDARPAKKAGLDDDGLIPDNKIFGSKPKQPKSKIELLKESLRFEWMEVFIFKGKIPLADLEATFDEIKIMADKHLKDVGLQVMLVQSAYLCGKKELADSLLSLLLQKKQLPPDSEEVGSIADIAWDMGRKQDALAFLKPYSGKSQMASELYVEYLYRVSDFKELRTATYALLKKWPDSYDGHKYLAYLAIEDGDFARMRVEFKRTEELDEFGGMDIDSIVKRLIAKGYIAEAKSFYLDEQLDPRSGSELSKAITLKHYASMLNQAGMSAEAILYFKEAYLLSAKVDGGQPATRECFNAYVAALKGLGSHEELVKLYQGILAADPYAMDKQFSLTNVYILAQQYDKAARQIVDMIIVTKTVRDGHKLDDRLDYKAYLTSLKRDPETLAKLIKALTQIDDDDIEMIGDRSKKSRDEAIIYLKQLQEEVTEDVLRLQ